MRAVDLYSMEPELVTFELGELRGHRYDHLPDVHGDLWGMANKRVIIRHLRNVIFDDRRIWSLKTIWFNHLPVMIVQNGGREGDDHHARYITSIERYTEMVRYINSLIPIQVMDYEIIDATVNDDNLTNFYGGSYL
ncbi:hypothetical protein ABGV42_00055 [Paenibacillus pabuli]|uniref:hypothetical protein n=1 Tax=Paenibacillus pabuli TaxID=1472 RepID=UPI003242C9C6